MEKRNLKKTLAYSNDETAKSRSCYQVFSHLSADAASSRFSSPTSGRKFSKSMLPPCINGM